MLEQIFDTILSISIAGTLIAIPFSLFRIFMGKKIRKSYFYMAWCLLFLRLMLPWGVSVSAPSFFHETQTATVDNIPVSETDRKTAPIVTNQKESSQPIATSPQQTSSTTPTLPILLLFLWIKLPYLWLVGMVLYLLRYGIVHIHLARRLRTAFLCQEKTNHIPVYTSDAIDQPFVFGFFSPRIYLPKTLIALGKDISPVILHEEIHIQRKDHWIQAIAFLILCVHWFNPFVHMAFYMLQKDMEMSCDETVLTRLSSQSETKKEYATLLLDCAIVQKMQTKTSVYYVAFGKNSILSRIKNIMAFHGQKKSISILSLAFVAIFAVILTLQPIQKKNISLEEPFGILLMGKSDLYEDMDAFVAVVLDTDKKTVEITPISRDFSLLSKTGEQTKLSAFAQNGYTEEEITKHLASVTGLPLHFYATTNVATFEKAIDAIGGIDFTIPELLTYQDYAQDLYIYLEKGEQHLNGEQTGHLMRYRRYPEGALQRDTTIANVFQTIAAKLTKDTPEEWRTLLSTGLEHDISTNLALPQYITLWETIKELHPKDISVHLLEYDTIDIDHALYTTLH